MKIIGTKYQIYENGESKIYRDVGQNSTHYSLLSSDGTKKMVREQELINKYVRIIPDAFMNIMITDTDDYPDVYVCVNKASSLAVNITVPDLILRQSLLYNNDNQIFGNNIITFGMCVTTQNTSSDLSEFMEFKKIEESISIAIYIEDNIDDIFNILDTTKFINKVNKALINIKTKYGNSIKMFKVEGYVDNLRDLMQDNEFIPRFRELFNVTSLNWEIDLGKESHDKNDNIILNRKQIDALSNILEKEIKPIVVIKYDRDIDISKIISFKHIIVSDLKYNMYLIAYEELSSHTNTNNNSDIISAMIKNKM